MFETIFLERDYEFATDEQRPLILDCGANIGLATLFFKRMYPEARVVAFEPEPAAFAALRRNGAAAGWRDVELIHQAVSDSAGTSQFHYEKEKPGSDLASLRASSRLSGARTVTTTKLSDFIRENVDFLKLDIEGAETAVVSELDASGKLRSVRQLVMEFHHHLAAGDDLQRVLSALERNGFAYTVKPSPFVPQPGEPHNSMIRAWRADASAAHR